jgi:hypothetical protein
VILYPEGARWYLVVNGEVSSMIKSQNRKGIKELFFDSPARHERFNPKYVVVKPRGRNKWWLFIRWHNETPRLLDTSTVSDGLIMRAVMLPNG